MAQQGFRGLETPTGNNGKQHQGEEGQRPEGKKDFLLQIPGKSGRNPITAFQLAGPGELQWVRILPVHVTQDLTGVDCQRKKVLVFGKRFLLGQAVADDHIFRCENRAGVMPAISAVNRNLIILAGNSAKIRVNQRSVLHIATPNPQQRASPLNILYFQPSAISAPPWTHG
ncbi:MAG: hypothetical protein WDA20_07025 [Desulfuromonadales bacterium]